MTVGGVREWRRSGGTRRYLLEDCGLNYVVGLMFYGDRKRLQPWTRNSTANFLWRGISADVFAKRSLVHGCRVHLRISESGVLRRDPFSLMSTCSDSPV